MARVGFIHDMLEIKFLLLYILARAIGPINLQTLTDLALCDQGVEYFDFTTALAELVDTEHVTLNDYLYEITEKGRTNGSICEDSLAYSVRLKCDRNLIALNNRLRRDAQVRGQLVTTPGDTLEVQLTLDDPEGNLLTLNLAVGSEHHGKRFVEQFKKHPQEVYNGILNVLLSDFTPKKEILPPEEPIQEDITESEA